MGFADENVDSKPRRHESSSSWGPTPQEAESGDSQPEWRRPRPPRNDDDDSAQSEWQRPRPGRNEDEEVSEWRRPRPQREEERPPGANWAQVLISMPGFQSRRKNISLYHRKFTNLCSCYTLSFVLNLSKK